MNLKCPHDDCIGTFHLGADTVGSILICNADGNGPAHATCPQCDNPVDFRTDATGEGLTIHPKATA